MGNDKNNFRGFFLFFLVGPFVFQINVNSKTWPHPHARLIMNFHNTFNELINNDFQIENESVSTYTITLNICAAAAAAAAAERNVKVDLLGIYA